MGNAQAQYSQAQVVASQVGAQGALDAHNLICPVFYPPRFAAFLGKKRFTNSRLYELVRQRSSDWNFKWIIRSLIKIIFLFV